MKSRTFLLLAVGYSQVGKRCTWRRSQEIRPIMLEQIMITVISVLRMLDAPFSMKEGCLLHFGDLFLNQEQVRLQHHLFLSFKFR